MTFAFREKTSAIYYTKIVGAPLAAPNQSDKRKRQNKKTGRSKQRPYT